VIERAVIGSDTITDQRLQKLQRKFRERSVLDLVNGGHQSLQITKPPVLTVRTRQGLQEDPQNQLHHIAAASAVDNPGTNTDQGSRQNLGTKRISRTTR
jgi:hypothetical protein